MRIEHVNIAVHDPDKSAEELGAIFGWKIRWEGPSLLGGRTIHLGGKDDYLALYKGPDETHENIRYPKGAPLQHIGIEVDDLDEVEKRVVAAGLKPTSHGDYEPGRRFYFLDRNGIEFEVVSYC